MASSIEDRISESRHKARKLYIELDRVRTQAKDTSLEQYGSGLNSLPKSGCSLKLYNTLKGHHDKLSKFTWSDDSSKILSCSQDGYMIIWDVLTGYKISAILLENQWVLTCAYSLDEKLVASGGLDNVATIYRLQNDDTNIHGENGYSMFGIMNNSLHATFKGHTAYISDCEFVNNHQLISASGDMSCILWDINKGMKISSFNEHLGDVLCLDKVENNPNLFMSGSSDGYVNIWDIRQSKSVQSYFTTNSDVTCLKNFNDGNSFLCGSDDGMIRLIDLRSDCELNRYNLMVKVPNSKRSIDGASSIISKSSYDISGVMSIDVSKSYRLLYACYADYGCLTWDLVKNEVVGPIGSGHSSKINQVCVSPNGLGLATASWDATVRIWLV